MVKIITSYTAFNTSEGLRLSYTFSEIDEEGNVIRSNVRKDLIVVDKILKKELNDIFDFLDEREAGTE